MLHYYNKINIKYQYKSYKYEKKNLYSNYYLLLYKIYNNIINNYNYINKRYWRRILMYQKFLNTLIIMYIKL